MTPRLLVGALVLVAAACSSGGGSASTSGSSPAATGSATTAVPGTTSAATTPATGAPTTTARAPATTERAATTELATTEAPETAAPETAAPTTALEPATTAPTAETSSPPELTAAQQADQELARSALITLDSFPDGWIEEPESSDESAVDDEFQDRFDACLGRDDDLRVGDELNELAVSTGDFQPVDDTVTSVSHEVVLAPDADTAITAMTEVAVDGAEACIADVIKGFYELIFADDPALDGIAIGEVVVTRTERERPADIALGVLLEIPLTLDGEVVSQFLEILYQRQGRALSELSFTSFGSPFSRDGYVILSDEAAIGIAAIGN